MPSTRRILGLALLLAGLVAPGRAQTCPAVVWADEFDGAAVDTSRWSFQLGDGCDRGLCGWGNAELQFYHPDNAVVEDGLLRIVAREEARGDKRYTSARLRTLGKGDWTFGRFEARLRVPRGQGLWPAFWMLPTDAVYGGWPHSGEIDIMEILGHEPERTYGTLHFGDPAGGHRYSPTRFVLPEGASFADDFHTFAIEREPGEIRWFIDDVLFATKTPDTTAPDRWPFDERFHFLLNLAVGGHWPGNPDSSTVFPQAFEVDYVRVSDTTFPPHLAGPRTVPHGARGMPYRVVNAPPGSTFRWAVSEAATLVSGQGTEAIRVDWNGRSGAAEVTVESPCGTRTITMHVVVEPPYAPAHTLATFEAAEDALPYQGAHGTFEIVANPDTTGFHNPSARSGRYARNAAEKWDVLTFGTDALGDAAAFLAGEKRFYLDVYTDAPRGTEIVVLLESGTRATATNYPAGRHSRYHTYTVAQDQWQRLAFRPLDVPDSETPGAEVDTIVLSFRPGSRSGDVYYLDNFEIYRTENP